MKTKFVLRKLLMILIAILVVQSALLFISPKVAYANPDEFKVSDYGSGEIIGGAFWRGYAFTVNTEIIVTALIGGGTQGTFEVGLYEANPSDYTPTSLLASYAFTSGGKEQVGSITSVVLSPGKTYILAQGQASGAGNNYCLVTLNAADVVSGSPIIDTWYPDNSCLVYSTGGPANSIIGFTPSSTGNMPKIGFQYSKPAKSTEKPEPVWVRTMPMTCYRVWINEDNDFQFLFWYPYADNNWVRIYDMAGNMVYEMDMPYDNPNLIVDLPSGMYTVKTFHDQPEPLQTFVIGKP